MPIGDCQLPVEHSPAQSAPPLEYEKACGGEGAACSQRQGQRIPALGAGQQSLAIPYKIQDSC